MTNTYHVQARCLRPFVSWIDVEADTPEEAIAKARREDAELIAAAEDGEDWPWDEFAAYDPSGKETLRVLDAQARLREAAPLLRQTLIDVAQTLAGFGSGSVWTFLAFVLLFDPRD